MKYLMILMLFSLTSCGYINGIFGLQDDEEEVVTMTVRKQVIHEKNTETTSHVIK